MDRIPGCTQKYPRGFANARYTTRRHKSATVVASPNISSCTEMYKPGLKLVATHVAAIFHSINRALLSISVFYVLRNLRIPALRSADSQCSQKAAQESKKHA